MGEQACYVLGRNEDQCDFGLAHPSISRQHAAIVHDKNAQLMLMDLGSAQGTFVNGKEIEPNTPCALNGLYCHHTHRTSMKGQGALTPCSCVSIQTEIAFNSVRARGPITFVTSR